MAKSLVALAAGILLAAAAPGADASAQDLERGEKLYALCAQCHGEAGAGNSLFLAPSIAGLDVWYVEKQLEWFRSGVRGGHPDDWRGMRMMPMARTLKSDEDLKSVAAYVAGLPPVKPAPEVQGGDAAAGEAHYAVCSSCHGPDGSGNQQMGSPPLNHASDWYLLSQLERYRAGIRGANPANPNGAVMRSMALTLPNDQALKDVVAYIGTLSEK